jgi:hypothetical protein
MKMNIIVSAAIAIVGGVLASAPALADVTFGCKVAYPDQSAVEIDVKNTGPELGNCVASCTTTAVDGSTLKSQWGATVPAGFDGAIYVDGPHPELAPLKNPVLGDSWCTPPR